MNNRDSSKKSYQELKLDQIEVSGSNVRDGRKLAELKELSELTASISKYGVLQPVVVVKKNGKYDLIIGQRRFHACQQISEYIKGTKGIPAIILEDKYTDLELKILSLSENIQRKPLDEAEEMKVIRELYHAKDKNVNEVAAMLGISPGKVRYKLKIDEVAPEEIKKMFTDGKLKQEDVRRIIEAADAGEEAMVKVAKIMQDEPLTKTAKEHIIELVKENPGIAEEELKEKSQGPYPKKKRLPLDLPGNVSAALERAAQETQMDMVDLIVHILRGWLEDRGFLKNEKVG